MATSIDSMYKVLMERNEWDTMQRIRYMRSCGYELPDIDNYSCEPMSDVEFEQRQHRWLFLFQLTTGVERAAVMQLAVELFKNTTNPHLNGAAFFSTQFSDATRAAYYAKAMCMLYRDLHSNT